MISDDPPYIVMDLNPIREMPSNKMLHLPEGSKAVFASAMLDEIANSDISTSCAAKLERFCEVYYKKIYLGEEWPALISKQRSPRDKIIGAGALNNTYSQILQNKMEARSKPISQGMRKYQKVGGSKIYNNKKKFFTEWCKLTENFLHEKCSDLVTALRKNGVNYELIASEALDGVNIVDISLYLLEHEALLSLIKTDPWQKALREHPRNFAIGRMTILLIWYGLLWTTGPRAKKFENNWEDLQYIFLASYFGCIMTRDKGIKKCVSYLFPSVKVICPEYQELALSHTPPEQCQKRGR